MFPSTTTPKESPTTTVPDKYQEAIEYLIDHPDQIEDAWLNTCTHVAGCLFSFAGVGCLTMIHSDDGFHTAWTEELTCAIRSDSRIPDRPEDISLLDLPTFAEWQRRLDREPH